MRSGRELKKKKRKPGNIFIAAGCILIFASLCIVVYNIYDGRRAGNASDAIVHKLDREIPERRKNISSGIPDKMPVVTSDGHRYIGELIVPSLSLRLPVMENWSYRNLRISPCRYSGSYLTDDLVICGHNYARHFSPLKWVNKGAKVSFVTADDEKISYKVEAVERLLPTDVDKMAEKSYDSDNKSRWDMTLFTCYTGGFTRCAVRCKRTDQTSVRNHVKR